MAELKVQNGNGNGNGFNRRKSSAVKVDQVPIDENIEPKRVIVNYEQGLERWEGRVAVVTGASSPIGKAVCESLVSHGLICCGLATRAGKHELEVRNFFLHL